ncbi:lysophospholipase [Aspergillus cavernicola]|uniref:Lysophospholipase n=1 Tax=Aspergillus cavernicola TaxID=176166 RepID=A0ABR4IHV9_9EURO
MKTHMHLVSVILSVLPFTTATPIQVDPRDISRVASVAPRGLPDAPNGYAPRNVTCPADRPKIRGASTLSPSEESWLQIRQVKTLFALKEFFGHVSIPDFDAQGYLRQFSGDPKGQPTIGIALSGGGDRALLQGAGVIKALDSRTENSTVNGQLGGLLQAATYVSGLSGGSWLVGSIFMNNFSTISDLQSQHDVWNLNTFMIQGLFDTRIRSALDNLESIEQDVIGKKNAGFTTTFADLWGRYIAHQMVEAPKGGVDYTWSSIGSTSEFENANMPMPLVVANGLNSGETVAGASAPIFEYNPWEFGTFDTSIYGFAPLEFLGSRFVSGSASRTSSLPFSMPNMRGLFNSTIFAPFSKALTTINTTQNLRAAYDPNPFYHYNQASSSFAQQKELSLVDAGEDDQNLPLWPLIQREREVDIIFASDSGSYAATHGWPNGESLVSTYERTIAHFDNSTSFPSIPDDNTFVNLGLNSRPTFFGCDSSNLTEPSPLVVYLPNAPITTMSNYSDSKSSYNAAERNSSLDSDWTTCVGCAVLSRSFDKTKAMVPSTCTQCFQRYCWNGTIDSRVPSAYNPTLALPGGSTATSNSGTASSIVGPLSSAI